MAESKTRRKGCVHLKLSGHSPSLGKDVFISGHSASLGEEKAETWTWEVKQRPRRNALINSLLTVFLGCLWQGLIMWPGWPGTHCVNQGGLEFIETFLLGLKAWACMPGLHTVVLYNPGLPTKGLEVLPH